MFASQTNTPIWLSNFINIYQQLNTENLDLLNDIYHQDIEFADPMHKIVGLDNLHQYFTNLYTNLTSCHFIINETLCEGDSAAIYWTMEFSHKQLNKGKPVTVEGHSYIKGSQNKVNFHRDYVDVGAMLYEHIPVVGKIIKAIKTRAAK
ncbi:nuclear transport factor 2 family protein [Thalassomonas sp. M1454]|nr:nuclear transport factor 2 family protein [Thalassomonas sp. M1454]